MAWVRPEPATGTQALATKRDGSEGDGACALILDQGLLALHLSPDGASFVEVTGSSRLSPARFHARFRAATGTSPVVWLTRCRLNLAQQLLADTDLDVDTISRRCGLRGRVGLWRLFRKAGLEPPGEWRARTRGIVVDEATTAPDQGDE